jgi:TolA-binding protein
MRPRITAALFALVFAAASASPAAAANKEHQQLMADIRMLQEQAQLLQNMLGTINDSIKAVNARLEEQANANRKAFADQKLQGDNISGDLRIVREKVDDNNVRIASLTQEIEALRQMVQQSASGVRPSNSDTASPTGSGAAPTGSAPPVAPSTAAAGTSPTQLYEMALGDYTIGQWELAIQGFDSYIRTFPRSTLADEAQVKIGVCYDYLGQKQKALEAFDTAIRDYPNGKALPTAYFRKGLALRDLRQPDKAREAFQYVVQKFPDSPEAGLSKQALDQLKKP